MSSCQRLAFQAAAKMQNGFTPNVTLEACPFLSLAHLRSVAGILPPALMTDDTCRIQGFSGTAYLTLKQKKIVRLCGCDRLSRRIPALILARSSTQQTGPTSRLTGRAQTPRATAIKAPSSTPLCRCPPTLAPQVTHPHFVSPPLTASNSALHPGPYPTGRPRHHLQTSPLASAKSSSSACKCKAIDRCVSI